MDIFQLIGEALIAILKHGWSLTAFAIIAAALFRFEPFIRFLLKHMPKNMRRLLKRQEKMDQRIDRIEQKIDLLLQKEGVTWGAEKNASISSTSRNTVQTSVRKSSISYFKAIFHADTVKRYTRQASTTYLREEHKMSNFLSGKKKILVTAFTMLLIVLNSTLGLNLDPSTMDTATYIGGGYVALEALKDIIVAIIGYFQSKTNKPATTTGIESSYHGE